MKCPCGLPKSYEECCGPYHNGTKIPPSPEALMRFRYSAFVKKKFDYLQKTMLNPGEVKGSEEIEWLGLEVLKTEEKGDFGLVEFVAYYRIGGKKMKMHEISRFQKIADRWYYTQKD
jgi:SEC-C motif-containing protein